MTVTAPRSQRVAYATLLRHAIHAILSEDGDVQALCDRPDFLVVSPGALTEAQLPVYVVDVTGDARIGGIGDRRRARVLLAAFAEGGTGPDDAEALIQLARERVTVDALQRRGLEYVVLTAPSEEDGDAFDLRDVPVQLGRAQLVLDIAATVPLYAP
jgi:hypothetical protein